ncbi:MAG TPA: hypothetical protein VJ044_16530, partial [Candidatus Hodarchaeales archaeon]|nr:hypothetical protein [Candidatus Hodarchaeales archaeon]
LRRTTPWDTTATAVFVLLALTPLFQGFLEMAFHIIYQLPIITAAINVLLLVAIAVKLKLASFQKKQIFSISS